MLIKMCVYAFFLFLSIYALSGVNFNTILKSNKELEAKGYITLSGRVSRKYFYERLFV